MSDSLLELRQLKTYFKTRAGDVRAVDGVDLAVRAGETVGLVGESGSGKSVTARSIMRLLPTPPARYAGGQILFKGQDLLALSDAEMSDLRGGRISMIFQDPMTFLNPVFTAGEQVAEAIRRHQGLSRRDARTKTIELFKTVGIPNAERRFDAYPHELSGGLRQRVMIAIALSSRPELLIADEPTTALDVTIQAQILDLLRDLQAQFGMSILLITHDLGVVAEMCDSVAVMYAGRIVEQAPVETLFADPEHPYTIGLMNAIPRSDLADVAPQPIEGSPPDMARPPAGCRFNPRCPYRQQICVEQDPTLISLSPVHRSACHFAGQERFELPSLVPIPEEATV
ncbi:MAG: ABC transporter ATP-binding protein [Thermomicrobiales bacterium]|nr:ABC transporter ATP-binding protein [Thermomicrobiales bacterium]